MYEKALELRLEILAPDDPDLGLTYAYLGYAYYHLDDHPRAQIYFNSALDIFKVNPKSTAHQKYSTYNNLGISHLRMSENNKAIRNIKKSSRVITEKYGPNYWDQINRYNNLGILYANIGQLDSAGIYIHWAMQINLSYPDEINSIWLADSYSHLGSIYMYQRIFDSAIYYYQKSIPMLRENDSLVSNIYNIIAQIYFNQGLFYESKAACIKSIQTLEPNEENLLVNIEDSRAPMAVFYPAHFLAKTQLNIYNQTNSLQDLTDALNYYHQLEQLKDIIRNEAFSNEAKYQISDQFILSAGEFLTALASDPTEFAFHERNEIVFEVMERNRYSELFRNVINIQNSSKLDVPDSLLQLEKLLASQISVYHKKLSDENDSVRSSQLLKYEREYQKVKQALSVMFPSYYESKFGKELIDLKTIQSRLEENEQILEYFWADSLIVILSITSDSSRLHYTPISESLEKQILGFHSFCSEIPPELAIEE
ncbi:MAG: tetratricopeptide repeat protein, partial [Bacteroidetes bacterium]|nr:tetratricopeptide repeat protein [Bacteroidota bacterium]